mmetsp:Transcript_54806/g.150833  ORF Transcript_54806/g.150833 Transcript_54806/m.150833 type:complete len:227 (+) Transcript_54806:548-1228(+)
MCAAAAETVAARHADSSGCGAARVSQVLPAMNVCLPTCASAARALCSADEDVKADIRLWWPRVRPCGYLLGDDFVSDGHVWKGVRRAALEFVGTTGLRLETFEGTTKWAVRKPCYEPHDLWGAALAVDREVLRSARKADIGKEFRRRCLTLPGQSAPWSAEELRRLRANSSAAARTMWLAQKLAPHSKGSLVDTLLTHAAACSRSREAGPQCTKCARQSVHVRFVG